MMRITGKATDISVFGNAWSVWDCRRRSSEEIRILSVWEGNTLEFLVQEHFLDPKLLCLTLIGFVKSKAQKFLFVLFLWFLVSVFGNKKRSMDIQSLRHTGSRDLDTIGSVWLSFPFLSASHLTLLSGEKIPKFSIVPWFWANQHGAQGKVRLHGHLFRAPGLSPYSLMSTVIPDRTTRETTASFPIYTNLTKVRAENNWCEI